MARYQPVIDFRRPQMNADGIKQMAASILAMRAPLPLDAALPQAGEQLPLVDRGIDGLMRDVSVTVTAPHATHCAGDRLRRPPPVQQCADHAPRHAFRCQLSRRSRRDSALRCRNLGGLRGIPRSDQTVAAKLATQGTGAASQLASALTHGRTFLPIRRQQHRFFRLNLLVTPSFVHASPYEMSGVAVGF